VLRCVRAQRVALIERLRNVSTVPLARGDLRLALAKARFRKAKLAWFFLKQAQAKFYALPAEEQSRLTEQHQNQVDRSTSFSTPTKERDEFEALYAAMPDPSAWLDTSGVLGRAESGRFAIS
jgi:hypothetical protein